MEGLGLPCTCILACKCVTLCADLMQHDGTGMGAMGNAIQGFVVWVLLCLGFVALGFCCVNGNAKPGNVL